jgi:predicted metal-dependent peptidase
MTLRLRRIEALSAAQRQKWAAARVWTARQAPYLASALLAMEPIVVEQDQSPTHDLRAFPSDPAWHVYLDPDVVEAVAVPEIGFWLLHQVTHLLRHHADRYPGAQTTNDRTPLTGRDEDQRRWNLAGDAEIDDDLTVDGLSLPDRAVTPSGLGLPDAWIAEQYWAALADDPLPDDQPDCGTGCDGRPRDWNGGFPGLSETSQKLLRRDVARRIREHTRTRGTVPAGWQRWADDVLEPVVNWRHVLRSAIRRAVADVAGRVDFNYSRPSRRASAVPQVILPTLRQPLPTVAVVIDTSGSMSDQMLAQVLGEVSGLLASLGVARERLHVVCCDAKAFESQRVLNAREVRLLGGGGTDMGAGLAATADLRPRPDLVVVLTDGHTPWPAAPPRRAKVVVGLMDQTGSVPDWAVSVPVGDGAVQPR